MFVTLLKCQYMENCEGGLLNFCIPAQVSPCLSSWRGALSRHGSSHDFSAVWFVGFLRLILRAEPRSAAGMMGENHQNMYCVPKSSKIYPIFTVQYMVLLTLKQFSNDFNSTAHRCEITLHLKRKFQIPSKVLQEYSSVLVVSPPSWIEPWMNPQIYTDIISVGWENQASFTAEAEHLEPQ